MEFSDDCDKALCIDSQMVVDIILAPQPEEWVNPVRAGLVTVPWEYPLVECPVSHGDCRI